MSNIAKRRFKNFQNYLSNANDKEREAAISLVKILDAVPTKKKRIEILKKVATHFNLETKKL